MLRKNVKAIATVLLFLFAYQLIFPLAAYALSGGPSQPEVQSFEPIGTTQMVETSTGDFVYNIPLIDVDGYPINLSYHSGITTDQEASWVGLGWNINPGVINRSMRGLPDDFNGDEIKKEMNLRPNVTVGVNNGASAEIFGLGGISTNFGIFYNNYKGWGSEFSLGSSISIGATNNMGLTAGLGLSSSTSSGASLSPSIGLSSEVYNAEVDADISKGASVGASYNSRDGLKALTFGFNASFEKDINTKSSDKAGIMMGGGGGSAITFAKPTYIPQISHSMSNISLSLSGKLGIGPAPGVHLSKDISGYFSRQTLREQNKNQKSYGFFYAQNGNQDKDVLHDFNREKDGVFTRNTPSLPLTNYSYDLYSVSGQGIGGMYKPFRGDVGVVYDNYSENKGDGGSLGGEIGGLPLNIHGGADGDYTWSTSSSGIWEDDNYALKGGYIGFQNKGQEPDFEPFYFKSVGEKTGDPDNFYTKAGGSDPLYIGLNDLYRTGATTATYENESTKMWKGINIWVSQKIPAQKVKRIERNSRNAGISYLTADEAAIPGIAVNSTIKSFNPNTPSYNPTTVSIPRNTGLSRKGHHLSEITAYREDGSRYVYGIAAYNNEQREVTFNISGVPSDPITGMVLYSPGQDNSKSNKQGVDHYYSKVETPGYAHSYLLTDILSPDYSDVDETEGPSAGDYGNYTKINYTRLYDNYAWRVPIEQNTANFNEGYKTDFTDDKANYVSGTKEYWYVHSIETKNYVAEFYLSDREDGLGVAGENGGKDAVKRLKKLDKIVLYSLADRKLNQGAAVPIKTVIFEYDYSLCGTTGDEDYNGALPNNTYSSVDVYSNATTDTNLNVNKYKGKLTLKKVYFTYGKSEKGRLSSYQFEYNSANKKYHLKAYDRWGHYMPESTNGVTSADYPYVTQNADKASEYASAWCLTDIKLPSGGKIHVAYEADDYAYVQDRRAMNMIQIIGIGSSDANYSEGAGNDFLIDESNNNRNYLYFKLPREISAPNDQAARVFLGNEVIGDIIKKHLHFRFLMALGRKTSANGYNNYEYVSGYAKIEDYGIFRKTTGSGSNTYEYGYVKLKEDPIGDRENGGTMVNPISKIAWQYTRLHLPHLAYGITSKPEGIYDDSDENDIDAQKVSQLTQHMDNIVGLFKGFNRIMRSHSQGIKVALDKSWIRLYNMDKRKFGGGVRVKQLTIRDEWNAMGSSGSSFSYAQRFEYSVPETTSTGEVRLISTGVASYEPVIGGDENPFREPDFFDEKNLMAPDNRNYLELPYGESFFPSPSVVYSKVRVTNVTPTDYNSPAAGSMGTRTGYTQHEFYTAYDFPTITKKTAVRKAPYKSNPILKFLKIHSDDFMTASQGYTIELNDMHGKPKAELVYAEGQKEPISGYRHFYQTSTRNPKELDNNVQVINKLGEVTTKIVGVDMDMIADAREGKSETKTIGLKGNLDVFLALIVPVAVPIVLPGISRERTQFRSMVTTKVVNKYGILQKSVAYQDNARIETENLAYDEETGQCIVTRISNEFNNSTYSFSYPAHWAYDGMGAAYKNIRLSFGKFSIKNGGEVSLAHESYFRHFVSGDEVLIESLSTQTPTKEKAWVLRSHSSMYLIDKIGKPIKDGDYKITVIRSGRRNLQNTSIGSVTSELPLINGSATSGFLEIDDVKNILGADATEFRDNWQTYCNSDYEEDCVCSSSGYDDDIMNFLNSLVNESKLITSSEITVFPEPNNYDFSEVLNNSFSHSELGEEGYGSGLTRYRSSIVNDRLEGIITLYELRTKWTYLPGPDCNTYPYPAKCFRNDGLQYEYKDAKSIYIWSETGESVNAITGFQNLQYIGVSDNNCPRTMYQFTIQGIVNGVPKVFKGQSNWPIASCEMITVENSLCRTKPGDNMNPYVKGLRGNWRPVKSYTYLTERKKANKVSTDGAFKDFDAFWNLPDNEQDFAATEPAGWTWTSEITKFDPSGHELENKDALGRYSAELFGYNNTMVKAVANNAKYQQIGNDNFEDYNSAGLPCEIQGHFDFNGLTGVAPTDEASHTGKKSLKVSSGSITAERTYESCTSATSSTGLYVLQCDECVGRFAPEEGQYVLSAWVKGSGGSVTVEMMTEAGTTTKNLTPTGLTIEGWQRVEGDFTVPFGSPMTKIKVQLIAGSGPTYFDDIRVHPFNSTMKTYVYDPITLRLSAILDENNYATFYEYDEEGALTRVKKETKDGVFTVQETRAGKAKTE